MELCLILCLQKHLNLSVKLTIETSFSDCRNMIETFLRVSFKRIPSKNIVYRDYKHFNQNDFLHELDLEMNKGKFYNSANTYDDFFNLFKEITDKYTLIKQKKIRGNNVPL